MPQDSTPGQLTHPTRGYKLNGDYVFMTDQRAGLGDIDLDLFYEHTFSEDWVGELMVGLRLPTGGSSSYVGNPYRASLGNGNHWELKLGGLMAWQPIDWMNIKLNLLGSWVIEGTEERCATFKGANIKNMGPKVDADVDWAYFVGSLDFTLFHPKTDNLSTTIGYEFYYKTEDNINFKKTKITSWLARKWNETTNVWDDYEDTLDSKVAEKNTEAISHKIRWESRIQLNKWCEMFVGGSYIFAGQNMPRETDGHCGFNVKF